MIVFLVVISYFGFRFATFNGSFSMPAIDFILTVDHGRQVSGAMSMYWIYMLIPVGCLVLAGACRRRAVRARCAPRFEAGKAA